MSELDLPGWWSGAAREVLKHGRQFYPECDSNALTQENLVLELTNLYNYLISSLDFGVKLKAKEKAYRDTIRQDCLTLLRFYDFNLKVKNGN